MQETTAAAKARTAAAAKRFGSRVRHSLRGVAYRSYYRLARANYERELFARHNRTPAGTFRCYEPLNRHGDDRMLAAVDARCGSDAVVYDAGANVGIYALALTTGEPDRRVVAFEPAPLTVEQLRANVRLNRLEDRIEVRACGLGEESDTRPFYVSTYPELSGFDRKSATRWEARVESVVSVPIRRVDGLLGDLPPPDAIKLDVEGAAAAVLRGARETLERHHPVLFVEIHDQGLSADVPGEIHDLLVSLEYDVLVETNGEFWRCEPR
ncbi:FkbM family methyltransferase [Halobacteria archaeon AArc-dxtr1]|nr:FkbM family methyltransferase [Halobacteria archaeon AArc-dxtr1]